MDCCYIAGDVESSRGSVIPPESNMVSFAMCEVGNPSEFFYAELKVIFPALWDWRTEDIHRITRPYLAEHGREPSVVMHDAARWVRWVAHGRTAVYCAMPTRFDWGYMEWYFRRFGIPSPFGMTLDGRDQYRQLKGLAANAEVPRTRVWNDYPTGVPHTHHALSDTFEYEEVVAGMLRAAGKL